MECARFTWVDFYKKFAFSLRTYQNDRKTLISKIKSVFQQMNIKLPKLEKDNDIVDIDPFTVYGLFNKSMKNENRLVIIEGLKKEFAIDAVIPKDFYGISGPNKVMK